MLAKARSWDSKSWGYINQLGEYVIVPQYLTCHPFSEYGKAAAYDSERNTIILFDSSGKSVEADAKISKVAENGYDDAKAFSGKLSPVMVKNDWGYMDIDGNIVVKPKYEWVSNFDDQKAVVFTGRNYLILDLNGEEVKIPIKKIELVEAFSEGSAAYMSDEGLWGFLNHAAESVVEPAYRKVGKMSEGMAWTKNNSFEVGFIDNEGNQVIESRYQDANDFSDGFALVQNKKNDWIYVDKSGNEMFPTKCDEMKSFKEGLAAASVNGKYGFLDQSGSWAIDPQFDETKGFKNGYAPVRVGSKWGYINRGGELVIAAEFYELGHFEFTTIAVDDDGDNIRNELDRCPDKAGVRSANGCPDEDGDGVRDELDQCSNTEPRLVVNPQGCPDRDGDGCFENEDLDDWQEGPKECGCMPCPDSDGDGIIDNDDKCPYSAGLAKFGGCPEVKQVKRENDFQFLFGVTFSANQTALTALDELDLKKVLDQIKNGGGEGQLETANFLIECSVDPEAGEEDFLEADVLVSAVTDYFLANGVDEYRIKPSTRNLANTSIDPRTVNIYVHYIDAEVLIDREKREKERLEEAKRLAAEAEAAKKAKAARLAKEKRLAKEAEAARKAEEARLAEERRIAEEAEAARRAEEARIAEEKRLALEAEAARLAKEAEAARRAEEARLAEERRIAEEAEAARRAEEARIAEEKRLAEEAEAARLAEEARIAEEKRLAEEAEAARIAALRDYTDQVSQVIRKEDFENLKSAFTTNPTEGSFKGFRDGKFETSYSNRDPGFSYTTVWLRINGERNYSISTEVEFVEGDEDDEMGIVWARKGAQFLMFGINQKGEYSVRQFENSYRPVKTFVEKETCSLIKTDEKNHLQVVKESDNWLIVINGKVVLEFDYLGVYGNEAGFIMPNNATVQFDNFIVGYTD